MQSPPAVSGGLLETIRRARTALFVPGNRPDRFAKAAASAADLLLLDLEDAVEAPAKQEALAAVLQAVGPSARFSPDASTDGPLAAVVRINPADAPTHAREVDTLLAASGSEGSGLLGLMLPKAEDPEVVADLGRRVAGSGIGLILLVESAVGMLAAPQLAEIPGVTRLALGGVDYCLDIEADPDLEAVLDHPRTVLALASRAAELPGALDTPSTSIRDLEAVESSARRGRALGMGGKLCIHPGQLAVAARPFLPSEEELAWARRVLDAAGGAVQVDGAMVDRPVQDRARRILTAGQSLSTGTADTETQEKDS